jgi:hypothetical protein
MKRLQIALGQKWVHPDITLPLIDRILESTSHGEEANYGGKL